MSQPLNIGNLNLDGSSAGGGQPSLAYSTSPIDQFSPPKHHYPLNNGDAPAAGSFSARMMTSPKQTNGFPASSPSSAGGLPSATSPRDRARSLSTTVQAPKVLTPFVPRSIEEQEEKVHPKVLLLENVNESAINMLREQGYVVETEKSALGEQELIDRLVKGGYSALGIRSKTKVTAKVIESVKNLVVIGCFCIGTNQVDLLAAGRAGIAVFNSPFSNSRSVAELVISEIVALSRQMVDRANEMRQGIWNKVSKGCWEIRGKTLGIVGYGHIGAQLSVLAEAMGMQVRYFDVIPIMPLGQAQQVGTLDDLLAISDFLTLHVPEIPETMNLIGAEEMRKMKKGSYLINNARGKVVDLAALATSLKSGHLAGAAIDVFPREPAANGKYFNEDLNPFFPALSTCPNLILTPHIGGSTEEAQRMIGAEVGAALIRYINFGSTLGAVNFPEVSLKPIIGDDIVRLCFAHLNRPGVLKAVNAILGAYNVERQLTDSKGEVAYLMADIAEVSPEGVRKIYDGVSSLEASVATRVLY